MISLLVCFQELIINSIYSVLGIPKSNMVASGFYFLVSIVALWDIYVIRREFQKTAKRDIYILIGICLLIAAYITTLFRYGYFIKPYLNNFAYTFIRLYVPLIVGYYLAKQGKDGIEKIVQWLPAFIVLVTVGSLLAAFNSSGQTEFGGYIEDESGFRYQNVSYTLAYAFGMAVYYVINARKFKKKKCFDNKFTILILWALMPFQLYGILLSGGKGGFVMAAVLFCINIWLYLMHHTISVKVVKRAGVLLCGAVMAGVVVVKSAMNSSLDTTAFFRIIRLITLGDDTGRSIWWDMAFDSTKKAPAFGHGLGSVPYELTPYSHNYFLDAMVEHGVIGLLLLLIFFVWMAYRFYRLVTKDEIWGIVLLLFLCGFVRAMFSGYYLSCAPLYWGMGFVLGSKYIYFETMKKSSKKHEKSYLLKSF